MLPPADRSPDPAPQPEPQDGPRHPFTYRAPAEREPEPPPLTSEDVAEEARRNDAVLIWAAALMGIVFACTTIADSRALVHVRSGRYLAGNGLLPPATDVFSATAAERPWVNLSWLFDIVASGLQSLGGFTALTALQVVAAVAVVVLLLNCRRPALPSWWAAFVVVLATVALIPQLVAGPALVTLSGLAATLWLLTRCRHEFDDRAVWWFIPLFAIWSNLDPRMFLGLAVLVLYGLGELAGSMLGGAGFDDRRRRGRYWLAVAAAALASLLNPFTWRAPLGALFLYGDLDPAFQQYYRGGETSWIALPHLPLYRYPPAALLDTALLAALLLAAVSCVALVLNRRRLDFGDAALWLGFLGLGIVAGREWPAAAIVFSVVAIQNAEDWYRASFRQVYGTDRAELFFSRGGRAVTVIAFAALAGLWFLGKFVADDGRRPGFGLDAALSSQVASLSEALDSPFDRGVFNFHAAQGDLLIWLGYRPFIDHRLDLYRTETEQEGQNLITLHDAARRALREQDTEDREWGRPSVWRPILNRFEIVVALPRLTLPSPDYVSYFDLLRSPDWRLTDLGAAGAVFYHAGTGDPKLAEYLAKNPPNVSRSAFRDRAAFPASQAAWPRERSWSDSLSRPAPSPNEFARGVHALQHMELIEAGQLGLPPEGALTFGQLALRDFYATLAKDPQNSMAYQALGRVFELLYSQESQFTGVPMQRRLYQSLSAYGQARTIVPDDPRTHERLVPLYLTFGKADLASRARDEYELLAGQPLPGPADEAQAERWDHMWEQLRRDVRNITTQARSYVEQGQPRLNAALYAYQNNCSLLALDLLDDEPELIGSDVNARQLRALLLLDCARPREAFELLAESQPLAEQQGITEFREPLALASLALPDFARAEAMWRGIAETAVVTQLATPMRAVPLAGPVGGAAIFPIWQIGETQRSLEGLAQQVALADFNAALCELEAGQVAEAEKSLAAMLARQPLTRFTPLAAFYLQQIRGEPVQIHMDTTTAANRFDAFEERLDDEVVHDQLTTAGPVAAKKPVPPGPGTSPAPRPGLSSGIARPLPGSPK